MLKKRWILLLLVAVLLTTPAPAIHAQDGETIVANGITINLPAGWVADTTDAPYLIMAASDPASLNAVRPLPGQQALILTISPAKFEESLDSVVESAIVEYNPAFDIAQGDIATEAHTQSGLVGSRTSLVQTNIEAQDVFIRVMAFRVAVYDIEVMLISNGPLGAGVADTLLNGVVINSQLLLSALNTENVIARFSDGPRNIIRTDQIASALPVPLLLEYPLGWDGVAESNRIALASNQVVLDYLLAADLTVPLEMPGIGMAIFPVPQNLLTADVTTQSLVSLFTRQESNTDYIFSELAAIDILGFDAVSVDFDGPAGQGTYAVFLVGDVFMQYWTVNNVPNYTPTILDEVLGEITIESSVIFSLPVLNTPDPIFGFNNLTFRTPRGWSYQTDPGVLYIFDTQAAFDNFATLNLDDPASYTGSLIIISSQPRGAFGASVTTPRQVLAALGWQESDWLYPNLIVRDISISDRPAFLVKFDAPLADTYFLAIDAGSNWLLVNGLSTDPTISEAVIEGILNSVVLE